MMEWLVVVVLLTLAAAILVWPLWRHTERPLPVGLDGMLEDADQERRDEKKRLLANLRSVRQDYAEGRLADEDFRSLEAEYQQQLATILEDGEHTRAEVTVASRPALHRIGSVALLALVGASSLLMFNLYWKGAPSATPATQTPDIDAMVQRLEARLAANPNDAKGQIMMARSYASLGRQDDAVKAWQKALEVEPGNSEALGGLAMLLLQSGSEDSVREALKHIGKLRQAEPQEPAWLWYQAMGLNLLGKQDEAKAALEKMLPMLPPESENAAMVRDAIAQITQAK